MNTTVKYRDVPRTDGVEKALWECTPKGTNASSKKIENHAAAVARYFMNYNFGRVHQTLRVTPAMKARVANHVWPVAEIVGLLD